MKQLKTFYVKNHRTIATTLIGAYVTILNLQVSYGAKGTDLKDSKVYTGTKDLITDGTNLLTGLLVLSCIGLLVYFSIRKGAADDMDQKKWQNRKGYVIISLIVGLLANVIVNTVAHYYGIADTNTLIK